MLRSTPGCSFEYDFGLCKKTSSWTRGSSSGGVFPLFAHSANRRKLSLRVSSNPFKPPTKSTPGALEPKKAFSTIASYSPERNDWTLGIVGRSFWNWAVAHSRDRIHDIIASTHAKTSGFVVRDIITAMWFPPRRVAFSSLLFLSFFRRVNKYSAHNVLNARVDLRFCPGKKKQQKKIRPPRGKRS